MVLDDGLGPPLLVRRDTSRRRMRHHSVRDRRAVMTSRLAPPLPLGLQRETLMHAETMLLVDHRARQP